MALNRAFDPTDVIEGQMALWMDAADIATLRTTASNTVSAWYDKSPNKIVFSQSTASQMPTIGSLNGKPSVQFTAQNSQYLSAGNDFTNSFGLGSWTEGWYLYG
jgi:hypothetical protein